MKKVLFAGTALVAFGFAAAAQAAEPIKLSVGGFMRQWVGYADIDNDNDAFSKVDVQSDTEVHFKGSSKLDNGLTVGVTVELEGGNNASSNAATQIDEQYLHVSGGFGKVIVGSEDNVGALFHNAAPDVGIGNDDGNITNWVPNPGTVTTVADTEVVTYMTDDGDAEKITYITPSFAGFQAGVSYTPDANITNDTTLAAAGADAWTGGVSYNNKISDVEIKADVAMFGLNGIRGNTADGSNGWQAGLNLGYAGFTLGGSYLSREVENRSATANNTGRALTSREGNAWTVGVAYKTGPMGVSLGYGQSEAEGTFANRGEDKLSQWIASGSYTMGPGVDLRASVFNVDFEDETNASANNREGWGAVTGVAVAF